MTKEMFQSLVDKVRSSAALSAPERTDFVRYMRFGYPTVINTTAVQDAEMDAKIAEEKEKLNFRCQAAII